jgi:hypothetical protein
MRVHGYRGKYAAFQAIGISWSETETDGVIFRRGFFLAWQTGYFWPRICREVSDRLA